MNKKQITLTPQEIYDLIAEEAEGKWEGWWIDAEISDGEYNGSKGAMTDYPLHLYNPQGELVYVGEGGYWTEGSSHMFHESVEFTLAVENTYYLLTYNEDWGDEHNVPALAVMTYEEYVIWQQSPIDDINTYFGNHQVDLDEDFRDYGYTICKDLVKGGKVKVNEISEDFYNTFKEHNLNRLSMTNLFEV